MKLFIIAALILTTQAHAKVKKEVWNCGKITATFSTNKLNAILTEDEETTVPLTFATRTQKSALNGSQKTILKGILDEGYDTYSYKATFIRSQHPEFKHAGKARGQVILETWATPSCVEPILSYEVLDCEVQITE